MKRQYPFLVILLVLSALAGCEEPYDLDANSIEPVVVIEGVVLDNQTTHTVLATKSQVFGATDTPVPITGGFGYIRDVVAEVNYPLTEVTPGRYSTTFDAAVGDIFQLSLTLEGITYTATDTVKRVSNLDSVSYKFEPAGTLVTDEGYYLTTYDIETPGKGDFREYRFFKNGDPNEYTLENIRAFQDLRVDGNAIIADWAGVFRYDLGDTFAVELRSITQPAYNYLIDLNNSAFSGSPFSGPPYTPRTNIQGGEALGFFMCQAISRREGVIE